AILVGALTILADDPLLTRRLALSSAITPHRRLVLDGALRVPATARVFSAAGGEVWLVTAVPSGDPRLAPFLERGVQVFSRPAAGRGGRVVPEGGSRGPRDRVCRAASRGRRRRPLTARGRGG